MSISQLKSGKTLYDLFKSYEVEQIRDQYPLPPLRHTFGLEFEFLSPLAPANLVLLMNTEGLLTTNDFARLNNEQSYQNLWYVHGDGSINTFDPVAGQKLAAFKPSTSFYGIEVSSKIITQNNFWELQKFVSLMNKSAFSDIKFPIAIKNTSCGLHIHVGVENLTQQQKTSVFNCFKTLEPELYNLVPGSRKTNSYCRSVRGMRFPEGGYTDRYRTLNVSRYNTFEYRMFYSTKKWWVVKSLVYLLDALHSYAETIDVPYNGTLSLYDITENPNLWHFISTQKRQILESSNTEERDYENMLVERQRQAFINVNI